MKPGREVPLARHGMRLLMMGAVVLVSGCLIIPVPEYKAGGSRGNINEETTAQFQIGVTTKEDVILLLGEPDYSSEDGRRLGYSWGRVKAWLFVGGPGAGAAGEISREYFLSLVFDEEGRLADTDVLGEWFEVSPEAVERSARQPAAK